MNIQTITHDFAFSLRQIECDTLGKTSKLAAHIFSDVVLEFRTLLLKYDISTLVLNSSTLVFAEYQTLK